MSHSPLPWHITVNRLDGQEFQVVNVVSPPQQGHITGEVVAVLCDTRINSEKCEANANLIVQAVNHHAKLVNALQGLLDYIPQDHRPGEAGYDEIMLAQEALAAVKGIQPSQLEQPETIKLLAWFVAQFDGTSGAGLNHWIQSPEYRRACELIGQELPPFDEDDEEADEPLTLAGKAIQYDKSGVGHCWVAATEDNCPPTIQEEIAAEIIDGKKATSDGERFSNGQHYRWS